MARRKLILLIILLNLFGCKSSPIKNDLIDFINKKCDGSRSACQIRISDATRFKWDRMILFGAWTAPDTIERVIKTPYDGEYVLDDNVRMIFLHESKVVGEEDFDQMNIFEPMLNFEADIFGIKNHSRIITPKDIFSVSKKRNESGCTDCFTYYIEPL